MTDLLVIGGADRSLGIDPKTERGKNIGRVVYRTMLWQICRDYSTLPDPRTLTTSEIAFWYQGLRHDLYERSKRRK